MIAGLLGLTVAHAAPLVAWVRPLPGPHSASLVASEGGQPVYEGDHILVGSRMVDALLVLDRRSGAEVGRYPAAAPVQSAAVVRGDRLYFSDAAGYTWCYRIGAPQEVWKHYSGAPVVSSPTLQGARIYVANVDDQVYALDAATGELQWRHAQRLDVARSAELELFGAPSPVVAGELVLIGCSDGTVVALDLNKGDLVWQKRVGGGRFPDVIAAPAVVDGVAIWSGYSEPTVAVQVENRAVRWRLDEVGAAQSPLVRGDLAWLPGVDGVLREIDVRTGDVRWSWDSLTDGALTQPVWTGEGLLVGSSAGGLYLVDPRDGSKLWELELGHLLNGVATPPAVDGDEAVVLTNGGNVIGLKVIPADAVTDVTADGARPPTP